MEYQSIFDPNYSCIKFVDIDYGILKMKHSDTHLQLTERE